MSIFRKSFIFSAFFLALTACSGGGGGSDSDGGSGGGNGSPDFSTGGGSIQRTVIDQYLNDVLIPFYTSLDANAAGLQQAVRNLSSSTTDANLQAARAAWVATRVPWEKNETALFGPVDIYGFDPAIDSWPVNRADLDAVINSGTPLTADTVGSLDSTLKGFHTIEYLLWGELSDKTASQITAREKEYLIATTDQLRSVTASILAAWVSGYNGQQPYALELSKAGQGSTTFLTEQSAIEQMIRGMAAICDEVANGKIADPFDTRDPNIVESQFSFNSIADFANNITGAQEAYVGSVSLLVASRNPALDAKVRAQFANAIAAINLIPEPFRNAIRDTSNDSIIINAQTQIRTLNDTLLGEVIPVVIS